MAADKRTSRFPASTRRKTAQWLWPGVLLAFLSACAALIPAGAGLGATAVVTGTAPSIAWFPATNTTTPRPTALIVPTEDIREGIGELLFNETFQNSALWNTAESSLASSQVSNSRLNLSIAMDNPQTVIASLRSEPVVDNFFAEAEIELNLCRADDRYGFIFRASSLGSYYRFTLNCRGETRLERLVGGQVSVGQDWIPSGDAPSGSPGLVRIAVWAFGPQIKLFLNDRLQYSLYDSSYRQGTLGFFAISGGDTALSVDFSNLRVYRVVQPERTATPQGASGTPPAQTPTP